MISNHLVAFSHIHPKSSPCLGQHLQGLFQATEKTSRKETSWHKNLGVWQPHHICYPAWSFSLDEHLVSGFPKQWMQKFHFVSGSSGKGDLALYKLPTFQRLCRDRERDQAVELQPGTQPTLGTQAFHVPDFDWTEKKIVWIGFLESKKIRWTVSSKQHPVEIPSALNVTKKLRKSCHVGSEMYQKGSNQKRLDPQKLHKLV